MKKTKVICNNCKTLKEKIVRLEAERDFLLTRRDEDFEKVEEAAEYWKKKFEQLNKQTNKQ